MKMSQILSQVDPARLSAAKKAYATHRLPRGDIAVLVEGDIQPNPGDLVLARVDRLGHHTKLELTDGRRAQMYMGDEIIVCFGNRYAPDQFEALVGDDLSPCHLVAAGGIAATVHAAHGRTRRPTEITPLGLLADRDGRRLNLSAYKLRPTFSLPRIPVVAVIGTSMNAGKTFTAAQLSKGLQRAGHKVGTAKVTGTGAGGDRWQMVDAGAFMTLDFTDAGYATTYRLNNRQVEGIMDTLVGHLTESGSEIAVLEIADGLFQKETKALLASPRFRKKVDAIVYAAADSIGAAAGAQWLTAQALPLVAISGVVTQSPLAMREVQSWTDIPILETRSLGDPAVGAKIWERLMADISVDQGEVSRLVYRKPLGRRVDLVACATG